MDMKKISILGSTGSIGTQTLEVVDHYADRLKVTSLACGHNIRLLEQQIRKYRPHLAAVWDERDAADLRIAVADCPVRIVSGMDGLLEVARDSQSDILVTAIVGMIGIRPTVEAIREHKDIALANKETLVTAGQFIMPMAAAEGVRILPVDSEHSAIFQSLQGNQSNRIRRILLTASGGPFRGMTREQLTHVTVADALRHPNWSMGHKITIDSATMINKGLEVMEAHWLFNVDADHIQVVVHPQSILHSAVEYEDGAVIGQMGLPDMKLPIQYALFYPDRLPMDGPKLDLYQIASLTFEKPDWDTFTGLKLARQAMDAGGNMPTILNAANERAVAMFLAGRIGFLQIMDIIADAMAHVAFQSDPSLGDILSTEQEVYAWIGKKYGVI